MSRIKQGNWKWPSSQPAGLVNYRALTPKAREVCGRMHRNQGWEIPADLAPQEPVREELTLWKGIDIFLNYPEIQQSAEKDRYVTYFTHLVKHFGKDQPLKGMWVPHTKEYIILRSIQLRGFTISSEPRKGDSLKDVSSLD